MKKIELANKCSICIPIIEIEFDEIVSKCKSIKENEADILEIRIDYFKDVYSIEEVIKLLSTIRKECSFSILFTFRTIKEGGFKEITNEYYSELLTSVSNSGLVDMIDIEDSFIDSKSLIKLLLVNTQIVLSYHNFNKTPKNKKLKKIIARMASKKPTIIKLAVMPQNRSDVIRVLNLNNHIHNTYPKLNYAIMAMGELGKITRIAAITLGSSLTFACQGEVSAPGQIACHKMNDIFRVLKPVTTIYFVRHSEPNHSHIDTLTRPLSNEGRADCYHVVKYFKDKKLDIAYSSPYLRSYTTILDTCNDHNIPIIKDDRLKERISGHHHQLKSEIEKRWLDKNWHEDGGESINQVQNRNIEVLKEILTDHQEQTIIVGTHGTALSSILSYYDEEFNVNDFFALVDLMPYIVKMEFYQNQ